jgi:hypothetical protein
LRTIAHRSLQSERFVAGEEREIHQRFAKFVEITFCHIYRNPEPPHKFFNDFVFAQSVFKKPENHRTRGIEREHPAPVNVQEDSTVGCVAAANALIP